MPLVSTESIQQALGSVDFVLFLVLTAASMHRMLTT